MDIVNFSEYELHVEVESKLFVEVLFKTIAQIRKASTKAMFLEKNLEN